MKNINIYKIKNDKFNDLKKYLNDENYSNYGKESFEIDSATLKTLKKTKIEKIRYKMDFYVDATTSTKNLHWDWVFTAFGIEKRINYDSNPKGIVLVKNNHYCYAITFGHSYHKPNLYCDPSWPFNYAIRLKYKNIKKTSVTVPNSQKNQIISGFLNYYYLDVSSGQGLDNLNAYVDLSDEIDIIDENVNIGNSLTFKLKDLSLESVATVIDHVEYTIKFKPKTENIPLLEEIKDENKINNLNDELLEKFKEDIDNSTGSNYNVDTSTYFMEGISTTFLNENSEPVFKYKVNQNTLFEKECSSINNIEIYNFIRENNIKDDLDLLKNFKIEITNENNEKRRFNLSDLIFYNSDSGDYIYNNGKWKKYNNDYEKYLKKSLSQIDVKYDENLNFDKEKIKHLKGENAFVEFLETEHGYINKHTEMCDVIKGHKLEAMDVFKDNTMYTIKFGNSSSKLCYSVDQSLLALKAINDDKIQVDERVENVCLWLVHTGKKRILPEIGGKPDINELKMFFLKNKIDFWKKEVRLMGYTPTIRINYDKNKLSGRSV